MPNGVRSDERKHEVGIVQSEVSSSIKGTKKPPPQHRGRRYRAGRVARSCGPILTAFKVVPDAVLREIFFARDVNLTERKNSGKKQELLLHLRVGIRQSRRSSSSRRKLHGELAHGSLRLHRRNDAGVFFDFCHRRRLTPVVVAAAELFLQPNIGANEEVTAAHFFDL